MKIEVVFIVPENDNTIQIARKPVNFRAKTKNQLELKTNTI